MSCSEVYTANMSGFIERGRELYLNARPSGRDCGTVHVDPVHPSYSQEKQKHADEDYNRVSDPKNCIIDS